MSEKPTFIFAFRQSFPEPDGVRIYPINSNKHSAGAICEEQALAAAGTGASRQAMGVIIPEGNSGKHGVMREERAINPWRRT